MEPVASHHSQPLGTRSDEGDEGSSPVARRCESVRHTEQGLIHAGGGEEDSRDLGVPGQGERQRIQALDLWPICFLRR